MNIIQKIKFLFKLKKAISEIKRVANREVVMSDTTATAVKSDVVETVTKPGWKTTEFWLVMVSNLTTLAGALGGVIPADTSAIIIAVLNGVYGVLRTIAKK